MRALGPQTWNFLQNFDFLLFVRVTALLYVAVREFVCTADVRILPLAASSRFVVLLENYRMFLNSGRDNLLTSFSPISIRNNFISSYLTSAINKTS